MLDACETYSRVRTVTKQLFRQRRYRPILGSQLRAVQKTARLQ